MLVVVHPQALLEPAVARAAEEQEQDVRAALEGAGFFCGASIGSQA